MILFHSLNFVFILKPDHSFGKIKIDLIRLYSKDFDNEEADEPIYNKINGYLLENYFYFTNKRTKKNVLFLDYSGFVSSYKNYENYLIEQESDIHGTFTTYEPFVDENYGPFVNKKSFFDKARELVLLSNHGYRKRSNILLIFDVPSFSGIKIVYGRRKEKYVLTRFVSTFVFYGLLIFGTEVVELISIIYEYQFERKGEVKVHKYTFLLERKDYIKEIINKINKKDNDKVSNIIKQYFSNYIQLVKNLISDSPIYTIGDKYELDNPLYIDDLKGAKSLLQNYEDLIDSYDSMNPYHYLKYHMVILSSRTITSIVTPKDLTHRIVFIQSDDIKEELDTINIYTDSVYFIDKKNSLLLVYDNQYFRHRNALKKLNTKELLSMVLKKQAENVHLFFPETEYWYSKFYESKYNWKIVFYFKSRRKFNIRRAFQATDQFHIFILKEVKIKMLGIGNSFNFLFMRYVIDLYTEQKDPKKIARIALNEKQNQFIIFSNTYLKTISRHFVNFFIEEEDAKQINKFISEIILDKYENADEHPYIMYSYAYGGPFKLKIILPGRFNISDIMEMYKDDLTYVVFHVISNFARVKSKYTASNNKYRILRLVISDKDIPKATLSMANDDYISRGIYLFFNELYKSGKSFVFHLSIAIPKHKSDSVIKKIQEHDKIVIEGMFVMNVFDSEYPKLYLNGFLQKVEYK